MVNFLISLITFFQFLLGHIEITPENCISIIMIFAYGEALKMFIYSMEKRFKAKLSQPLLGCKN